MKKCPHLRTKTAPLAPAEEEDEHTLSAARTGFGLVSFIQPLTEQWASPSHQGAPPLHPQYPPRRQVAPEEASETTHASRDLAASCCLRREGKKTKLKAYERPFCARNLPACHKPDMMYSNNTAP